MVLLNKLTSTLRTGTIYSNKYIGYPQHQTVDFGYEGYVFEYDWNELHQFLVLTIYKNKEPIFKDKMIVGNQYHVYSGRELFRTTGIKLIALLSPVFIDKDQCVIHAMWQEL